jgi:hypothetical protein
MRKVFILFLAFFCVQVFAQPTFQWVKNTYDISGRAILDPMGNIIIAGTFTGTADFDPGPGTYTLNTTTGTSGFICKLSSTGNFIWAVDLPLCYLMNTHKADAAGNIYSTGAYSANSFDTFLWKLDPSGNTIWLKTFGGSYTDNGVDLAVDGFGNVYHTGVYSSSDMDFDPGAGTYTMAGTMDAYLGKLDANGNFLWAKKIDNSSDEFFGMVIWQIQVQDLNGVYFCGQFKGATDFDPGAAIYTISAAGSQHDGFVAKLDTAGNFAWAGSMPSLRFDFAHSILKCGNDLFVTGSADSIADVDPGPGTHTVNSNSNGNNYILKINSAGTLQWVKQAYFDTRGVSADQWDNLYFAGSIGWDTLDFDPGPASYSLSSVSPKAFFCKLDSSGLFKWAVQLQDTGYTYAWNCIADTYGDVYGIGNFSGKVDFDPGATSYTMANSGTPQTFILKLTDGTTGLKEDEENVSVLIHPNPTSGKLTLISDRINKNMKVKLFQLTGALLMETEITDTDKFTVDISEYAKGIYILQLNMDGKEVRTKVIRG